MANSSQIAKGIIAASFGIVGVCIMAAAVLCVFVILCILIFAGQVEAMVGPTLGNS